MWNLQLWFHGVLFVGGVKAPILRVCHDFCGELCQQHADAESLEQLKARCKRTKDLPLPGCGWWLFVWQHQERERQEHNLSKNALLIQLDFMENMTWPLGPEEAQDWFWATSRESMTTLGFYVVLWSEGECLRQNWHYISQVLNHDSAYACQCLCLGATLVKLFGLFHWFCIWALKFFSCGAKERICCWLVTTFISLCQHCAEEWFAQLLAPRRGGRVPLLGRLRRAFSQL